MTLLCTYHHRMLHEGGFSVVKETDETLRFITADGRTIPRNGYRLEDFVDDDVGPSAEGFCTDEVREPAMLYRIRGSEPNVDVSSPTGTAALRRVAIIGA